MAKGMELRVVEGGKLLDSDGRHPPGGGPPGAGGEGDGPDLRPVCAPMTGLPRS
jgi:hypothetical protein